MTSAASGSTGALEQLKQDEGDSAPVPASNLIRVECSDSQRVILIDEVKRFDRTFAWVYARRASEL
jgi:hypothetical protein